jgi:hypothetical protein
MVEHCGATNTFGALFENGAIRPGRNLQQIQFRTCIVTAMPFSIPLF